ncbi:hypothetical protein KIW84_073663 [Lathyrus oleraceus]|uniref:Uncharacterized protein n=1 Tax=Pisum sativum TaxID=3888 RepID=A0A9D4VRY3_PEA|nr:hypothetical protein KIW84_073663 [Pisum sativum]
MCQLYEGNPLGQMGDGTSMSRLDRFLLSDGLIDSKSVVGQEKSLVAGSQAFVIKEKLKRLKDILRWLNREIFGWIDLEIEKYVVELNEDDVLLGNSNVVDIDEDQEGSGQDCLNVSN